MPTDVNKALKTKLLKIEMFVSLTVNCKQQNWLQVFGRSFVLIFFQY